MGSDSHLSDMIHQACESFYQVSDKYHIHHVSKHCRPAGERGELLRQRQRIGDIHWYLGLHQTEKEMTSAYVS